MRWHREWFIRVPWGKLALVSRGHPDGEPVLLVHGRQDSLSIFEPLIEQMSEQYYYVALDMPGNGLSDAFPHGPKLQRFHFLYAMELALLHLGWDRFIFMGHSMGCEQGLFYNVVYPNQITRMILLDAGPTLMRMQIEDNAEYQQLFYDSYYENYHTENFKRKTHTRMSATQSLQRLRELSNEQCAHLLARNFHEIGSENPNRPSNAAEASCSYANEAQNENEQDNVRVMYTTKRAQNPNRTKKARNGKRRQKKDELTDTDDESTDTDEKLTDTDDESTDTDEEKGRWRENRRENRRGEGDDGLNEFIQRMNDNDCEGYLSWDNRLKHLAPQNYGNEYYFELFKKIPPTLLIAASYGAKNVPPIPKWRQGAIELLQKLETLENFHRVDVEGSHDVHYTHPERVLPFINAFLKDNKVYSKL